jgi:hypothetical protein
MQKKPDSFAAKFHEFFTTRLLLGIIGGLLGMIAMRLVGW